ncbi:MAG TPA: hypothetical protein VMZ28_24380 [Kofleriaceae bacterium]|nr:hypothetical protein [Kofleriaceae bacterium]
MKRALVVLLCAAGCGDDIAAEDPRFASPPDSAEGLTNVSDDLEALLEGGALAGACERYRDGDAGDRRARLLCGKEMFFYESFDTVGAPASLIDHLARDYPIELGAGFAELGMVVDPSAAPRPLGLAPTAPLDDAGDVPAYAFTCASCHFAQLPDGRYAVGAPNHRYDYGRQILALGVYPQVAIFGAPEGHAPEAVDAIRPLLDRFEADEEIQDALAAAVLPLTGLEGGAPALGVEVERAYASWLPGTQDFVIAPLPLDDGVLTISKIIDLWDIPDRDEEVAAGMPHAMLAWTGAAESLADFVAGFAVIGGEEPWDAERLAPLVEYIYSLRAPANPEPPDAGVLAEGRALFDERGCADCHDGPRGSGVRLFDYDEVGTDDAMARWMDPDGDGEPCCGVELTGTLSGQVKSPRLTGMWAKTRYLHNGSVSSLEGLFCMDGPRGTVTEPAYGDGGHDMTCDLPPAEKRALIAYLLAH